MGEHWYWQEEQWKIWTKGDILDPGSGDYNESMILNNEGMKNIDRAKETLARCTLNKCRPCTAIAIGLIHQGLIKPTPKICKKAPDSWKGYLVKFLLTRKVQNDLP